MRYVSVVALISLLAVVPALAHDPYFSTLGWSGPYAGGGTTTGHPEQLCNSYPGLVCMVAAAHSFGVGLGDWPIYVTSSGGFSALYRTNTANTRGWIVVLGTSGHSWGFMAYPGSYGGRVCDMFTPAGTSGIPLLNWGTSRYYYQAIMNGSFAGGVCQ